MRGADRSEAWRVGLPTGQHETGYRDLGACPGVVRSQSSRAVIFQVFRTGPRNDRTSPAHLFLKSIACRKNHEDVERTRLVIRVHNRLTYAYFFEHRDLCLWNHLRNESG